MSNLLILNLFLASGFSVIMEQVNMVGFISGFIIGYLALWITQPLYGPSGYFLRVIKLFKLVISFLWLLVVSNFRVLWDIITPEDFSKPAVIGVPLDAKTDFEIMLLANMISLTPGSLALDVSEDRSMLYVHVMFLDDIEETRREIKDNLEKRLLDVIR
ncbi:MAG: Na+/H+ antiporter subunit E [Desulfobacteraceae bacterium]|nr:MAG: Na+/H+ antiporter subunit E [Desulfobacteraceae bacterium]